MKDDIFGKLWGIDGLFDHVGPHENTKPFAGASLDPDQPGKHRAPSDEGAQRDRAEEAHDRLHDDAALTDVSLSGLLFNFAPAHIVQPTAFTARFEGRFEDRFEGRFENCAGTHGGTLAGGNRAIESTAALGATDIASMAIWWPIVVDPVQSGVVANGPAPEFIPADPLFAQQLHLRNTNAGSST